MSRKAAANGQRFFIAFLNRVVKMNTASMVLLPFLNPNCSGPSRPLSSAALVIRVHIRTVMRRRILDGMVIGLYWDGSKVSPPCKVIKISKAKMKTRNEEKQLKMQSNLVYEHALSNVQTLRHGSLLQHPVEE